MKHRVKWLIVFLVQNVHEVQEDTKFMDQTLEELLHLKAEPSIAIAGCISTTDLSPTLKRELDKPVQEKGRVHNFVVQLRMGSARKDKRLRVLEELPSGKGLQHTSTVVHIFQLLRALYYYDHVLLTTWDHGSGFAIFAPPDKAKKKMKQQMAHSPAIKGKDAVVRHPSHDSPVHRLFQAEALRQAMPKLRKVRSLARFRDLLKNPDWLKAPYGLTMDRLRSAILASFGKVDVIFMRNCFMQTFDTGFTLHDVADYLVASENTMWFPAYNYAIWLKAMQGAGKGLTPEAVAATAILGFTRARMNPKFRRDTALFGNDLSFFPALNYRMDQMIRELIFYVKGHKDRLLHCRRTITDIVRNDFKGAPYQLVDARWWFIRAGKLLAGNTAYQEALKDFLVLHQRMVGKRRYVGSLIRGGRYHESGFSLYFPAYAENIARVGSYYGLYYALHSAYRSQFTRNSLWDEFIGYLFLDLPPHLLRRNH